MRRREELGADKEDNDKLGAVEDGYQNMMDCYYNRTILTIRKKNQSATGRTSTSV